ncbi:MAG: hypothetical protein M0Q26_05940 [Chitinophagaceae bacterium]|nr:hypothetical protein [Chitinophagaceae bacterium]MDP1763424.1 hypothetical protein [Sediminibacterium sp.]
MALITTIAQVQSYLRVRYTNSNATLPDIGAAEDRFIRPLIGQTLYDALVVAQAGNATAVMTSLLDKVRRAVVALAYWQDLPTLHVQIGELGVVVTKSENLDAAHRWEFENLREALAIKSCAALEVLLEYLFLNKTVLNWAAPDEVKTIIKTGSDFTRYFTVYQPNRTFMVLLPLVKQVEDEFVRTLIGDTFFELLRDKSEPTTEEKRAIELLKKAVSHLTINKAVLLLPTRISVDGFTVSLTNNTDQINQGQHLAPDGILGRLADTSGETGHDYLVKLKDYLDTTASAQVFSAYRASDYYTAPGTVAAESANANRNGVFGL